jgi:D-alanyl-D-alanine carboxypeptidase/Putative peptidoglycan binding domain
MRVIRPGDKGADVEAWQLFLRGQELAELEVDGTYGPRTVALTKAFQSSQGLVADGVVGPRTYARAQGLGFNPGFEDSSAEEDGPNWPPPPDFGPLDAEGRKQAFGEYAYEAAPTEGNPEGIRILGDWVEKNIVRVRIPQLSFFVSEGQVRLHRLAAPLFVRFFEELEHNQLADQVLQFGGTFAPRFIRGSRTSLSNHAYGSAMDLNVPWNRLGTTPALRGKVGSVRELVAIANACGLYWGGHFKQRPDGMHFEVAKLAR